MSKNESPKSGFWPGCLSPNFSSTCVKSGQVFSVNLESLRGKMVLLLFYPLDFGYICPTEIMAIQDIMMELEANNCTVLAISSGSVLSKVAFLSTPKHEGGLEGVDIGLVEDKEGSIARSYGVQREDSGYSYRSMVVLDKEGLVVARMLVDLPIGLGVKEALRIVKDTNKSQNNPDMESVEAFSTANLQNSEEVNEAEKEEVNTEEKKSLNEKSGQANNVTKETSEMKQEKQNEKEENI
jgi:peroxiredoxin (alkyl hydroperoxide reductase subunit C)